MSTISSNDLSGLVAARRLMLAEQAYKAKAQRKAGEAGEDKSLLEVWDEDEALLSGDAQKLARAAKSGGRPEETSVNLSTLHRSIAAGRADQAEGGPHAQALEVVVAQRERTEFSVEIKSLAYVDGLVKRDDQNAETDRYTFQFLSGTQFLITDKWSGRTTRVWNDPYVDLNDVEGDVNGDFKDLTASFTHTTFKLSDGTAVNFTARDDGVIEQVDITKGSQHLRGFGAGSGEFAAQQFFSGAVGLASDAATLSQGDVVTVGGDGNDWYDQAGRLVWGRLTGPMVTARPLYSLEMHQRTVTETYAAVRWVDLQQ